MEQNREEQTNSETESKTTSSFYDPTSAFKILEEDFSTVIQELVKHDRLGHYANEFNRLMDALRDAQLRETDLIEKNKVLHEKVAMTKLKLSSAIRFGQAEQDTIDKLNAEVEKAWKMIDTAHTREQIAQETIENLRVQGSRLTQEIETLRKMETDQEQEVGVLSKNKETLAREKERLLAEITHARERYAIGLKYQEELERRNDVAEIKVSELSTELEAQKTELAKTKRFKENLEEEVAILKTENAAKDQELQNQTNQAILSMKILSRMEQQLREEKMMNDKQSKENQELQNTIKLNRMEYEQLLGNFEAIQQEISSKNQDIKMKDDDMLRMKIELKKVINIKDSIENKLSNAMIEKNNLEMKKKDLQTKVSNLEKEIFDLKKFASTDKKTIDSMTKEKEVLTRAVQKCTVFSQEQHKLLSLQELNKKKIQDELQEQMDTVAKQAAEVSVLQNEKDRLTAEAINLNTQVQQQLEDLKLKEMELFDYKKRVANTDAKIKLQMSMYEQVRSERNQLSKSLTEANDEINELKHKLKVKSYQVEQLKEDIRTKESLLIKEEFVFKKVSKEKEEVKSDLQKATTELKEKKDQVALLLQEEYRLQKIIGESDKDRARLAKDLNQVSNERDILGTQLVRRNDELKLLYEKIKILQLTLQKGEAQYGQRLEDIRLLKIEVKKLRQEKAILARTMNNISDLRQELFHLERDFIRERLKCRALEEELQNPLNVHRWRKLEGSDPTTFELIQKIQLLQKRLLAASEEAVKRESQMKEMERLYTNLRKLMAKQPGPEAYAKLKKCQTVLKERGVKMKCLVAELTMCENQMSGFKFEYEKANKQLFSLKKKYFEMKKREQKVKQKEKELAQEKTFLPVVEPITGKPSKAKFLGAGFNIASATCVPRIPSVTLNA